jgi:hypothetical protein
MGGGETEVTTSQDAAARYRKLVDENGSVEVRLAALMSAFGHDDLSDEARHQVADDLWMAGLATQPVLGNGLAADSQVTIVDKAGAHTATPDVAKRYAINPAGVVLAGLGGLAMAIAAFLPLDEPGHFARVQENALIHHGGWAFVALGIGVAVAAWRQYSTGKRGWTVIVLGAIALADAIVTGNNHSYRTLYPLNSAGVPEESLGGTVVPLGIAIYLAGAGACAAILGGLIMRQSPSGSSKEPMPTLKSCPDCAETVQAAARVCKHCGYRFDAQTPAEAEQA